MGVQLNIKDPRTVELARAEARRLGKSVTETIRDALEENARRGADEEADYLRQVETLITRVRRNMPEEWRGKSSKELMDSIYDDNQPDGFTL